MNEKDDVRLDDILQQAHRIDPGEKVENGEEEVNAILASLGLGAPKKRVDVMRPAQQPLVQIGEEQAPVRRQEILYHPQPDVQRKPDRLPPPHTQAARIITAPVNTPVVEHETSTLELPSIKAFSEAQERRRAAIERAAAENALRRAAEEQRRNNPYTLPGMRLREENLNVEVDDNFREFFQTSAAAAEVVPEKEEPVHKKQKGRKRKTRMQDVLETVTKDAEERSLTGEFDVPMPRASAQAKKQKEQAAQTNEPGQQTLFDLAQKPSLPPIQWDALLEGQALASPVQPVTQGVVREAAPIVAPPLPEKAVPPPAGLYAETVQFSASGAQEPAPKKLYKKEVFTAPKGNAAQPKLPDAPARQPLFPPQQPVQKRSDAPLGKVFSDTFRMNRFDVAEQGQLQQPAPIPWNTIDLPEISLDIVSDFDVRPAPSAAFSAPENTPMEQTRAVPSEYREMLVDLPLTDTTDVTGELLPVYEVGAEDENFGEEEDYNHLSDAPSVHATLKHMRLTRILRICATALISAVLVYLNLTAHFGITPPVPALDAAQNPLVFLAVNLLLVLVGGAVCLTTLGAGLVGMVGRPSVDTLPALAFVGTVVQLCAYLFNPEAFQPTAIALTAPLAVLLLLFNTLGKWLHSVTVSQNFALASAGYDHAAAFLVPSRELTRAVCSGLSEPEPLLLVSRPTELVKGFMRQSFSAHSSDIATRKLSLVLLLGSVICGVLGGLLTKSVFVGISGTAVVLCLAAPLASTLVYAIPAYLLQKSAGAVGAVVPGPSAVQNIGLCNMVLLDAKDLFPATAVRFHGLQTFEKQRVDLAILYTASLLYEKCETLRDVFMTLIDNKKEILYKVDGAQIEAGYGCTGWIDQHQVMVGNRAMMRRHNINVPSRDYEAKYTRRGERSIIYLAVGGRLFGMFVVSYVKNASAQRTLDTLAASGISVLLQSDDFNVTSDLLMATYRVSPSFVKVLSQPERNMLSGQTAYMAESEGYMTHTGTCESFVGGLQAAAFAAAGEQLAGLVQAVALMFTLVLCLVLSFTLGVEKLSLVAMLLYQLAWCAVTVLMPLLKRR